MSKYSANAAKVRYDFGWYYATFNVRKDQLRAEELTSYHVGLKVGLQTINLQKP
ncbi:MAG: hypothetical protein U5K79_08165 [Cyclobacteriaceae bacterium]|nr:hypothetical protein [Cyclobacteriaceae bacterium]